MAALNETQAKGIKMNYSILFRNSTSASAADIMIYTVFSREEKALFKPSQLSPDTFTYCTALLIKVSKKW